MEIVINETLYLEELQSLNDGKEIDFIDGEYEGVKVKVKITGVNMIPNYKGMVLDKRRVLRENILDRYDNEEYWDQDILDNSDYDQGVE